MNDYSFDTHLIYDEVVSQLQKSHKNMDVQLIKSWFPVTQLETYTFLGSFAWTSRVSKKKWIIQHAAEFVDGGWYTPADLARAWLKVAHPKPLRCNKYQWKAMQVERSQPMYANPGHIDDAVYVDLKSAYWSIMRKTGWNVEYCPGRYIGVKSSVASFPFAHNKLARNCLVSVGRAGAISVWTGEKLSFIRKPNPHQNGVLWMIVQDVLNGIAEDMIRAGAQYVHTDGYIIDTARLPVVREIMDGWGMPWGIKHEGPAIIYGASCYDIGDRIHKQIRTMKPKKIESIRPYGGQWLRRKFGRMATN